MNRHGTLHPINASAGFVPRKFAAWPHAGYEGAFVWCGYWRKWDHIITAGDGEWVVEEVAYNGAVTGPVRTHRTPIDYRLIYPRPFNPYGE